MLFYPAALPLSRQTLHYTARIIRAHRRRVGSRSRKLDPGRQALLVLAYLRKGETFADLAAGFGIGATSAWAVRHRDRRTAGGPVTAAEPGPGQRPGGQVPAPAAGRHPHLHRPDGRQPPIIFRQAPQTRDEPAGSLPGQVHDLTASRIHGILPALATAGLLNLVDQGYAGVGPPDHPYKGRNRPPSQKAANRAHARLRGPGERANAQLKTWRILRKLRCCPWKVGNSPKPSTPPRPTKPKDEKAQCIVRLPRRGILSVPGTKMDVPRDL
jgi:Helix-turn-helix of DDE superfamily endonuclease/DDE superfamily endonuclease